MTQRILSLALRLLTYLCICLLLIVACAPRKQAFRPAEHATARSPEGYSAAEYEVRSSQGEIGNVKVWSKGAYRSEDRGREQTAMHIGFEIDNQTSRPVFLDPEQIELKSADAEGELGSLAPTVFHGRSSVPAGVEAKIDVYFNLPSDVAPHEIEAFRVTWTLKNGELVYVQTTPFLQHRRRYYYSPHYDPFYRHPYAHLHGGIIIRHGPFHHRHHFRHHHHHFRHHHHHPGHHHSPRHHPHHRR